MLLAYFAQRRDSSRWLEKILEDFLEDECSEESEHEYLEDLAMTEID